MNNKSGQVFYARMAPLRRNVRHWNIYCLFHVAGAFAILLIIASNAFAWGTEGHQVVAQIAEMHLTAKARKTIGQILGPQNSLVSVSTWADEIRPSHPDTAPWHYIDIPLKASTIDPEKDCPGGNCVTGAITRFLKILRNSSSTISDKSEALKFVVHFIGDFHQPLHCADDRDRGGTDLAVTFFGESTNLHSVWDTLVIERINPDPDSYAMRLNSEITDSHITAWEQGNIDDWALENHEVAQRVAYGALPVGDNLGTDYFQIAAPVVNLQLQKAGIRLAFILNQLFQ